MTRAVPAGLAGEPYPRGWRLDRGLFVFIWLLPLHILVMAFLFGALRWPGPVVRVVAAWKELLIALLFGLTLVQAVRGGRSPSAVRWLDLAVAALVMLAFCYLLGADVWFDTGLPAGAQLYGLRDTAFVSLLYFVGRATPGVTQDARVLRALFIVGVVTSAIAVLERIFVSPADLVVLGASRYVQDFLGASALTTGNVYGLPDNYWTQIGSHVLRRVGSTYLSAQGFAIPFLIVLPAATLWLFSAGRRRILAWAGYALLWAALLLTITRATILACAVQTLIIAGLKRRWGVAVTLVAAAACGFALALVLFPGFADFIWQTITWQTGSSRSHLQDWSRAFDNMIRYPLGAGLGTTDQNAVRFGLKPLAADNEYFQFALQLGLGGLLLHVAILAGILAAGWRAWRTAPREEGRSYGLLVAMTAVGIAINAMTATVSSSMMLAYVFLWLAGAVVTGLERGPAVAPVDA